MHNSLQRAPKAAKRLPSVRSWSGKALEYWSLKEFYLQGIAGFLDTNLAWPFCESANNGDYCWCVLAFQPPPLRYTITRHLNYICLELATSALFGRTRWGPRVSLLQYNGFSSPSYDITYRLESRRGTRVTCGQTRWIWWPFFLCARGQPFEMLGLQSFVIQVQRSFAGQVTNSVLMLCYCAFNKFVYIYIYYKYIFFENQCQCHWYPSCRITLRTIVWCGNSPLNVAKGSLLNCLQEANNKPARRA